MKITPIKTPIFREKENLVNFIKRSIPVLAEKSVLVVTSKIVALAEGRTAVGNEIEKERLIKQESTVAIRTKYVWLTVKDGMVMPAAGIDESNANGKLILLPKDSYLAARRLRTRLCRNYGLRRLGVVITDSRTTPLRAGTTGVALGYAGIRGVKDYRGTADIFGRLFVMSRVNVADSLAAAAVLTMGEGSERQPLAIITDAAVEFADRIRRDELYIDINDDMYRPLFAHLPPPTG